MREGYRVVTKARKHVIVQDLPEFAGGRDDGPIPPELLLASLAGCVGIVARFHAKRFGIDLKGVEMVVEGDYDPRGFLGEDVKPGFHEVRLKVVFDAPNASENKLKEFMDFIGRHCPIADTLESPTKVRVEVRKA